MALFQDGSSGLNDALKIYFKYYVSTHLLFQLGKQGRRLYKVVHLQLKIFSFFVHFYICMSSITDASCNFIPEQQQNTKGKRFGIFPNNLRDSDEHRVFKMGEQVTYIAVLPSKSNRKSANRASAITVGEYERKESKFR